MDVCVNNMKRQVVHSLGHLSRDVKKLNDFEDFAGGFSNSFFF